MSIVLVREAIITYVYNLLSTSPDYADSFKDMEDVYWADTRRARPIDAIECYLSVVSDESLVWGIDGDITHDKTTDKHYLNQKDPRIFTVNIAVTSMRSDDNKLTDLEAQNLAIGACAYIKNQLMSGIASAWFGWENEIFTPITVLTKQGDISDVEMQSFWEETKNRHTYQFTCKFRYDQIGLIETKVAAGATIDLSNPEGGIAAGVEIDVQVQ